MTDVVIVGAGLAGLTCARHLHRYGISFKILEASESIGGRVQTEHTEGCRLDVGFQVLLTAYPGARAELDYDALNLQPFYEGALVRYDGAFHRLSDPFRHPVDALSTLAAPVGTLRDKLKMGRLRTTLTGISLDRLFEREELTTLDALRRRWGFSEAMIDRFFRPFLGGITLDPELHASSRMFEFVFRMFAEGQAALPAAGMGAIPAQLAAGLPAQAIRLNARVTAIHEDRVSVENGSDVATRAIVVATEGPEAAALVGTLEPPVSRSVLCLYYTTGEAPLTDPVLVLNGDRRGPINNLSVLTNVAPGYAPPGIALISVSVLGNPLRSDVQIEREVRDQLTEWFGPDVAQWDHLRTYRILHALPDQAPPFLTPPARPVRLRPGLYVCGDHRRTASIDGAITAGRRAAEAVLDDFGQDAGSERATP